MWVRDKVWQNIWTTSPYFQVFDMNFSYLMSKENHNKIITWMKWILWHVIRRAEVSVLWCLIISSLLWGDSTSDVEYASTQMQRSIYIPLYIICSSGAFIAGTWSLRVRIWDLSGNSNSFSWALGRRVV